jgi:sterol carrier protein 2
MCCPTSDGGAAAIVASEEFVFKHGLQNQAIEIAGISLTTDSPRLFEDRSSIELTGVSTTPGRKAFLRAFRTEVDVFSRVI